MPDSPVRDWADSGSPPNSRRDPTMRCKRRAAGGRDVLELVAEEHLLVATDPVDQREVTGRGDRQRLEKRPQRGDSDAGGNENDALSAFADAR